MVSITVHVKTDGGGGGEEMWKSLSIRFNNFGKPPFPIGRLRFDLSSHLYQALVIFVNTQQDAG